MAPGCLCLAMLALSTTSRHLEVRRT
ncbi:hypothetical protein AG1IA_01629 [Rhizoctonia solani AG-1 IA]|uniref:Uncharacterized protein n=1 Tax=Thanatephorus cucumeris (strain AG1-IA) TaxID=983506 RepID=L8X219_THACA|nr:hypothetical protein AG1IA_01629 [Rhizoctonia solani AG-1 IA]